MTLDPNFQQESWKSRVCLQRIRDWGEPALLLWQKTHWRHHEEPEKKLKDHKHINYIALLLCRTIPEFSEVNLYWRELQLPISKCLKSVARSWWRNELKPRIKPTRIDLIWVVLIYGPSTPWCSASAALFSSFVKYKDCVICDFSTPATVAWKSCKIWNKFLCVSASDLRKGDELIAFNRSTQEHVRFERRWCFQLCSWYSWISQRRCLQLLV